MYDDYVQELRERLRATSQMAEENIKQAKIQAKKQYDKTSREKKPFKWAVRFYSMKQQKRKI